MKKRKVLAFLLFVCIIGGCGKTHEHTFKPATCTEPEICTECGETNGEALGHDFSEATCNEPGICSRCGETGGEALGHDIVIDEAVFATPESEGLTRASHCGRCGEVFSEQQAVSLDENESRYYEAVQLYFDRKYNDAFKNLYIGKESGSASIEALLGDCYYQSRGTAQDNDRAYRYFTLASEENNPIGLYGLAQCTKWGYGTEKDDKTATELFSKMVEAAEEQYDTCKFELERNYFTHLCGYVLLHGLGGEQDAEKALECFLKSAEDGFADSCFYAGTMYHQGLGTDKDDEKALEWYIKGAEGGDVMSQICAYSMYSTGVGCSCDKEKAEEMKSLAIEGGATSALLGESHYYISEIEPGSGIKSVGLQ